MKLSESGACRYEKPFHLACLAVAHNRGAWPRDCRGWPSIAEGGLRLQGAAMRLQRVAMRLQGVAMRLQGVAMRLQRVAMRLQRVISVYPAGAFALHGVAFTLAIARFRIFPRLSAGPQHGLRPPRFGKTSEVWVAIATRRGHASSPAAYRAGRRVCGGLRACRGAFYHGPAPYPPSPNRA